MLPVNAKKPFLSSEVCAMFNCMPDGVYITDSRGHTIFVNSSYERISGIKKDLLLDKHMETLIAEGYFKQSASLKVLSGRSCVSIMESFRGTLCLVTGSPVFGKDGQIDFVITTVRPMDELNQLLSKLERAEELNKQYSMEIENLKQHIFHQGDVIGNDPKMRTIYELVDKIASTDTTILLLGETGVGKEILAKHIHSRGNRKKGPFIKINCSAIPEPLFESELFGYESGAFTGAIRKGKPGLLELANDGVLLLDEIGDMTLSSQAKLLRVLQEKTAYRIGGTKPYQFNAKIISATNKDLQHLIRENRFREDLYYRLSVVPIRIPPLRERGKDLIIFAHRFMKDFNARFETNCHFTLSAYQALERYPWPGNIRELRNFIERVVLTCSESPVNEQIIRRMLGEPDPKCLSEDIETDLPTAMAELEKKLLTKALLSTKNTREAAKKLGISQSGVVRKAKRHGIEIPSSSSLIQNEIN
ncbi:MAG: sigma 54-interacting transcriptional regulator [Peptostreptococcaceae bacterium]|nr:sigma 54-interacting transcriptional regulator [Peptostreptococcaceae bacterium]